MAGDEEAKGSEPHHTTKRRIDGRGEDGPQADTTGKGPTLINNRETEKDEIT